MDSLDQRQVKSLIKTSWVGRPLYYYPVVNSTNNLLEEMAERGASPGTMVIADYQQRGRGRHGHSWSAPPGTSLLFSLLLRPDWSSFKANWLMMIAGLASAQAIENTCLISTQLKWPNDLVIKREDRWRKVGGILLEVQFESDRVIQAIIGIGINVNIDRQDVPVDLDQATSLFLEKNQPVPRAPLLAAILENFEQLYTAADNGHSPQLAWNERLVTIGQEVIIENLTANVRVRGLVEGTDSSGQLILRDKKGELHIISAGDVTLVG